MLPYFSGVSTVCVFFFQAEDGIRDLTVTGVQTCALPIFGYQYSPEIFTDTELDFALEVCEGVMDVWQPEEGREIILNLPATVERSTPSKIGRASCRERV